MGTNGSVAIVDARIPGCTDFFSPRTVTNVVALERDEKMTFGSSESTLKFESRTLSISVEGIIRFILPLRRSSTKHRAIIGCPLTTRWSHPPGSCQNLCQRVGSGQPQKVAPNEIPPRHLIEVVMMLNSQNANWPMDGLDANLFIFSS